MRYTEMIKKRIANANSRKYLTWALVAFAVILAFMSLGSEKAKDTESAGKEEVIERRIEELCEKIDGIKEAHVMVTLEKVADEENTALSICTTSSGEREKVIGVGIVCTNGDSGEVRREVTELISAVFSLPVKSIKVMKLGN